MLKIKNILVKILRKLYKICKLPKKFLLKSIKKSEDFNKYPKLLSEMQEHSDQEVNIEQTVSDTVTMYNNQKEKIDSDQKNIEPIFHELIVNSNCVDQPKNETFLKNDDNLVDWFLIDIE